MVFLNEVTSDREGRTVWEGSPMSRTSSLRVGTAVAESPSPLGVAPNLHTARAEGSPSGPQSPGL